MPRIKSVRTKKGQIHLQPNQKVLIFKKTPARKSFTVTNNEALQTTLKELDPVTFKLWTYFTMIGNDNRGQWALSCCNVTTNTGISESSYHRAMERLEEKGYLVNTEAVYNGNLFTFYDMPQPVLRDRAKAKIIAWLADHPEIKEEKAAKIAKAAKTRAETEEAMKMMMDSGIEITEEQAILESEPFYTLNMDDDLMKKPRRVRINF
jgi:DNA-binding Lrp family transcriptional regulator